MIFTTSKNPAISVIMPAFNAEKYIEEAINSILNQTFKDFEFIIIDDGSIDGTWEIISKFAKKDSRIFSFKNKINLKICETLNFGVKIARGKYVARMDADDISFPDRLEKQYNFMERHPEMGISGGSMRIINENRSCLGVRRYNLTDVEIRKKIFLYSPFSHPLVMIKKDVLKKSGLYNPNFVYAEDYDLYFRIGMFSKFGNLNDIILEYRMLKDSSTSKKLKEMELKTLIIRKKAIKEYGYKISLSSRIYYYLNYFSVFFIPTRLKILLFNLIRNDKN